MVLRSDGCSWSCRADFYMERQTVNCQDARDYLDWQCQIGHGDFEVLLDRRGDFCVVPPRCAVGIMRPEQGHCAREDKQIVYLTAVPVVGAMT